MSALTRSGSWRLVAALPALALLGFLGVSPAEAGQGTATLTLTAQVTGTCSIQNAAIDFGNYNADSNNFTVQTAPIVAFCTAGMPGVAVSLGNGSHGNGRVLADASNHELAYTLFAGSTGQTWSSSYVITTDPSTNSNSPLTFQGGQALAVQGEIPRHQAVPPGTYSDQLPIVMNF